MRRWVRVSSPAVAFHGSARTLSSTMKNQRQKKAPSILSNNINSSDNNKKFYLETFGCQMNVSDSELVDSILRDAKFKRTEVAEEADVILTNTCAHVLTHTRRVAPSAHEHTTTTHYRVARRPSRCEDTKHPRAARGDDVDKAQDGRLARSWSRARVLSVTHWSKRGMQ